MFKKRIASMALMILILISCVMVHTSAETQEYTPRMMLNGNYLKSEVMPIVQDDGIVLLPLRAILEGAGYRVDWQSTDSTVNISKNGVSAAVFHLKTGMISGMGMPEEAFVYQMRAKRVLVDSKMFSCFSGMDVQWDSINSTALISSRPAAQGEVLYYDLGTKTMETALGKQLSYTANGAMAVPEGENCPVVILLHGAHPVLEAESTRYDVGFSYLMKALADKGYLALSINVAMQYSFEAGEPMGYERINHIVMEHVQELMAANGGEKTGFDVNLTGKCDFSRTFLVGHSRSGQAVFDLSLLLEDVKNVSISGLVAIAPAEIYTGTPFAEADYPTAIILPQLDGDVFGLDGQSFFDSIQDTKGRKSDAQLVFLYGANHNAFNEALNKQDRNHWMPYEEIPAISAEKQRDFLAQYLLAFLETVQKGHSLRDIADTSLQENFGASAMISTTSLGGVFAYAANQGVQRVTAERAQAEAVDMAVASAENTAGLFNHPASAGNFELLKLEWTQKGGEIVFTAPGSGWNISDMKTLNLYLAQDSTNDLNGKAAQAFTVEVVGTNGKTARVLLDRRTPALQWQFGESIDNGAFYSSPTPLGMVSIPLHEFEGIESNVREIRFIFDQSESGSLMLRLMQFDN